MATTKDFSALMLDAISLGSAVRRSTAPNPWVGAVLVADDGTVLGMGATEPPGGRHAEIVALDEAGARATGGTLVVTLEPCAHRGRTGPCTEAVIASGVSRVVVGVLDPDPNVAGRGCRRLEEAGIEVVLGVQVDAVEASLAPYLHHRRTGRPQVVLKMAATLDGRTAAPDGSSRWITGPEARADVHRLRADAEAILVGAGTVRTDDPALTARLDPPVARQPLRFVLGEIPTDAACLPAESLDGPIDAILDDLGRRGVLQLLVEGGAGVAKEFLDAGLVDRLVLYLAPALFGGDDGRPLVVGAGAGTMEELRRGRFVSVDQLGEDLRVEVEP
jgi:diaminohydroxyphosphoribosylaminopyrimidine deaminase/5-amino-6-(5-phosphoribosylamino)uracil reductase